MLTSEFNEEISAVFVVLSSLVIYNTIRDSFASWVVVRGGVLLRCSIRYFFKGSMYLRWRLYLYRLSAFYWAFFF